MIELLSKEVEKEVNVDFNEVFQRMTLDAIGQHIFGSELQKRANRANQLVLFFLAGADFWEKHAKNRRKHAKTGENRQKHAKTGEKQRFFGANFFCGKNWSVLIFTPFATMTKLRKYK